MQELNKLGRKGLACSFLVIISEQYKTPNRKCIGHKTFVTSSTTLIQIRCLTTSCFSDRASWIDYILITNLMHWLLFIHKILFFSTCFETQVLIFRRIQLYTCIIWYCHSLWEFLVACRYTAWAVYRQATNNSHREWQYHILHVYNYILLKMSTWGSKHVEENSILWINNNRCIKLVINIL